MSETEEGDVTAPIAGDVDINISEVKAALRKKRCYQILKWVTTIVGVLILIATIIIFISLGLTKNEDTKDEDEKIPKEIYGNIICHFDINSGLINILSKEFENNFYLVTYIGDKKIKFSKTYNFDKNENKTVRYEIHSKNISVKNMFKGLDHLKYVSFKSDSGGKIISMESTFEECENLKEFRFEGWDTSELISMKSTFASCIKLDKFPFDDMDLSKVKDMSHMLENSNIHNFMPTKFDLSSVETLSSMFINCNDLIEVSFPKTESPNLIDISSMFSGCDTILKINISTLNTTKVINMNSLFYNCISLKELNLSDFVTNNVK